MDTRCYRLRHIETEARMIPDIALMIVVYGGARLVTAVLDPHRRDGGTGGMWATGISWAIVIAAVGLLAFLAVDVLGSSSSLPNLTR